MHGNRNNFRLNVTFHIFCQDELIKKQLIYIWGNSSTQKENDMKLIKKPLIYTTLLKWTKPVVSKVESVVDGNIKICM